MIPKQFNILGHEISVEIDNEYCHQHKCLGRFIYYENKIVLADKYKAKKNWVKYKESIVEHTFYHELTHCLLYHTGHQDLWLDEQLVDAVGGLLHQFEITKEYECITSKRELGDNDTSRGISN